MGKLLIVEPAYYGEGIVRAAYNIDIPLLLFAKKPDRVKWLKENFPTADVICTDTTRVDNMLRELRSRTDVQGITSGTEWLQPIVGELIERSGLNGPINRRTGTLARYKDEMRQAFKRHGVYQPDFRVAETIDQAKRAAKEIGYPCIFKPTNLGGSWCVRLVKNDSDLEQAFANLQNFRAPDPFNKDFDLGHWNVLIEQFVRGEQEVSIESISIDGRARFVSITEKFNTGAPLFIERGHVTPPRSLILGHDELIDFNQQVLDALEIKNGPSHCEVLLTNGGPRVVECACRNGGDNIMKLVNYAYGVDLLEATALVSLGKTPNLDYRNKQAAAIQFITPPPADRVTINYKVELIKNSPGYVEHALVESGSIIQSRGEKDIADRVGYIICVADSPVEARKCTEAIVDLVRFETK